MEMELAQSWSQLLTLGALRQLLSPRTCSGCKAAAAL